MIPLVYERVAGSWASILTVAIMGAFYASVCHSYEKIGYVIQQKDIETERNEPSGTKGHFRIRSLA